MLKKRCLNYTFLFLTATGLFSCGESGNESKLPDKKQENPSKTEGSKPDLNKEESFDIFHFLLDEEAKGMQQKKIDYKNHSVSFSNDNDPYSVSFSMLAKDDLNKDGIIDYIISRESEGMLGGNVNTNSEIFYLIMGEGNQIVQRHEILTYAPSSYNILDEFKYRNGKLKVKTTQNFRSYIPEEGEELQTTDLSFIYKNGNVYEESYLQDCELAKWKNKQLFTGNSTVTRTIDPGNYTETILEEYKSGEFDVSAEFSGCDNLSLALKTTFVLRGNQKKELLAKRNLFLEFMRNHTTKLSKELQIIQQYLLEHEEEMKEPEQLENLSFAFYISREKGKVTFRLIINQINNTGQTENWEITTRQ